MLTTSSISSYFKILILFSGDTLHESKVKKEIHLVAGLPSKAAWATPACLLSAQDGAPNRGHVPLSCRGGPAGAAVPADREPGFGNRHRKWWPHTAVVGCSQGQEGCSAPAAGGGGGGGDDDNHK